MGNSKDELSIVVSFHAKPGKEEELMGWMKDLPGLTRKEAGCIRYELTQEVGNQAASTFTEKFVDRAAFDAHIKMPYSLRFGAQLDNLLQSKQIRLHRELLPSVQKEKRDGFVVSQDAVVVIAHFTARPGKEKELQAVFQGLVPSSRSEPGCLRFEMNQDLDDPSTFTFVEAFADRASFDAHCATPYVENLFEVLPNLVKEQYVGLHKRVPA